MDKYIKTDIPGLVKDSVSGAVLNVDNSKLHAYRRQKRLHANQVETQIRLEHVESEISQIKDLLVAVLEKLDDK